MKKQGHNANRDMTPKPLRIRTHYAELDSKSTHGACTEIIDNWSRGQQLNLLYRLFRHVREDDTQSIVRLAN